MQTQQISTTDQAIAASMHPHDAGVFQRGGGADRALLHPIFYQSAENSGSQLKLVNDQQFITVAVTCQANLLRRHIQA